MASGEDKPDRPEGGAPFDMGAMQEELAAAMGGAPAGPGGLPPELAAMMGGGGGGGGLMEMAQTLAKDPAFMQMAQQMQAQMMGGGGGAPGTAPPDLAAMLGGGGPGAAMPGGGADYMQAMQQVMSNPAVMEMGQKMFEQMSADPAMGQMLKTMTDPAAREGLEAKIKALKEEDPSLAAVINEIESGGPEAMMKYWSDPEALSKLGKGMEKVLKDHFEGDAPGAGAEDAAAAAEEEEEEVIVHFAWEAAQLGDDAALEELLAQEADKDAADEEGRSGLHFACGYGELACAKLLLQAGAKVDTVDTNKNSPLHYAAGYGQLEAAELLVKHEADRGLKNADGHTAYEIAKMNNQDAIMKVLE